MVINIVLNIVMSRFLGIGGLRICSFLRDYQRFVDVYYLKKRIGRLALGNHYVFCEDRRRIMLMGIVAYISSRFFRLFVSQNMAYWLL